MPCKGLNKKSETRPGAQTHLENNNDTPNVPYLPICGNFETRAKAFSFHVQT